MIRPQMRASLFLLLVWFSPLATGADRLSVVFLSPDTSHFWDSVSGFMRAVATDLDIDLTILTDYNKNRFSYLKMLKGVLDKPVKPDYIILMPRAQVAARMLRMVNDAGVKAFTFNTAIPPSQTEELGAPREKLPDWIGHVAPDNRKAGKQLADRLIAAAQQKTGIYDDKPRQFIALAGTRETSSGYDRNLGLKDALDRKPATLNQLIHAGWSESRAYDVTRQLLARYPRTDAIWSANDSMALGAIRALAAKGRKPGVDVVIGGIDWENKALEAIRDGQLELSLGRHFMGGGLVLLLIHNYESGHDFATREGSYSLSYKLIEANRQNVDRIGNIMQPESWEKADFSELSRTSHSASSSQPVTANELMDEFMAQLDAVAGAPQ